MNDWKEGDKIRMAQNCSGAKEGVVYTLKRFSGEIFASELKDDEWVNYCSCEKYWKPVFFNLNFMSNLKEKFALVFKTEPHKSFRKAGITDGDDLLTEDGKAIFLKWLLDRFGSDFKSEVVDELMKKDED